MRRIGNTICLATSYNTPGKHDGDEFMREMDKFRNCHRDSKVWRYGLEKKNSRKERMEHIDDQITNCIVNMFPQNFVFFMHGWWKELIGSGYNIWLTHELANNISHFRLAKKPLNIVLYACGCGGGTKKWKNIHEYHLGSHWDMRGEFGFAMRLANDLSELGIHDYRIFAHIGRGHVTERPFCVWITDEPNKTNTGRIVKRREIVPYRSWASLDRKGRRQWIRWVKFMKETRNGRFQAPFLSEAELAEVIGE